MAPLCNAGGSPVTELVGELSVNSAEFARLWADHDIGQKTWGTKQLVHPTAGALSLRFEALMLPDESHRQLVVYLPADAATGAALDELITPAPEHVGLRVVANQ